MSAQGAGSIQPADDLLGHQTARRFSHPSLEDTAHGVFTERFWYMGARVPAGDLVFGAGLGYYPNRGVMDAYAGVTVDGVQYAFQGSRQTASEPLRTSVGPLCITVGEGLRSHRIRLEQNPSKVTMDLEYRGRHVPNDEGLDILRKGDEVIGQVSRFVQFGHYVGWIEADGRRFDFTPEQPLWGARDRSWGLRIESRTDESHPPVTRFKPLLFMWVCAQFPQSGIHFFLKETAPGQTRFFVGDETFPLGSERAGRTIARVEHELQWEQDEYSQHLKSGEFDVHFDDGSRKTLRMRALPGRFYLKAGLYGGYRGWFQGDDKGTLHLSGVQWRLDEAQTRRELRTLAEQVIEFRDGDQVGYGTIQGGLSAGYPKYPEVQHLPTM
jgi:hypothetical protein